MGEVDARAHVLPPTLLFLKVRKGDAMQEYRAKP